MSKTITKWTVLKVDLNWIFKFEKSPNWILIEPQGLFSICKFGISNRILRKMNYIAFEKKRNVNAIQKKTFNQTVFIEHSTTQMHTRLWNEGEQTEISK